MKKIILCIIIVAFCFVPLSPAFAQTRSEERTERADELVDYLVSDLSSEDISGKDSGEDYGSGTVKTLSGVEYLDYRIRPGIVLHIRLAGEGELDKPGLNARVTSKGTIRYPYIGEVDVTGFTASEVANKLEKLLEKDYVRAAQVTVNILETPKYYMLGKVYRPGMYGMELDRELALAEAIALAGGIKKEAGLYREGWASVRVIRTEGGERREYTYQVDTIDETFNVQPDDIVLLEYGKRLDLGDYYIMGEVVNPGRYPIVSEEFSGKKIQRWDVFNYQYVTLLGAANVIDAIDVAQGLTDDAARNYVRVRRKVGKTWYGSDKFKVFRVPVGHIYYTGDMKRNVSLKDGDVISVPESWF